MDEGMVWKNLKQTILVSVPAWLTLQNILHDLQILVCTAVKGSFLQLNLLASTFSPDGPLSSTDDDRHKNKQRKLQKVKVIDKLD